MNTDYIDELEKSLVDDEGDVTGEESEGGVTTAEASASGVGSDAPSDAPQARRVTSDSDGGPEGDVDEEEARELEVPEGMDEPEARAGADVIALLAGDIRPRMVLALDQLKQAGFVLGCITNNVAAGEGAGMARDAQAAGAVGAILARFDHVIESSKAGVRKPDPAIYRMMLDRIGIVAERAIYLDDLGINCKPAAALGMTAIKVLSEDQALRQLSALVCLDLG